MLTFPFYLHQFMLINVHIVPTQLFVVIAINVKYMVVTMLVPLVNLLVLKPCVNLHVLSAVINLLFFIQFVNLVTQVIFRCSVSCKPVSTLINSDPVKSFVTCKTVCLSNVSMAKEVNSVNYCLVTCTEYPVNVISSDVRKSVVSYRTACPVDFYIVVKIINVTLLSTYRCISFKNSHRISPTIISISELPLHLARPPATLSICSSTSSASSPPSPLTQQFSKIPSSFPSSLLLPPPSSTSSSQSALSLSPSSPASPSQSTFLFPSPPPNQHH